MKATGRQRLDAFMEMRHSVGGNVLEEGDLQTLADYAEQYVLLRLSARASGRGTPLQSPGEGTLMGEVTR